MAQHWDLLLDAMGESWPDVLQECRSKQEWLRHFGGFAIQMCKKAKLFCPDFLRDRAAPQSSGTNHVGGDGSEPKRARVYDLRGIPTPIEHVLDYIWVMFGDFGGECSKDLWVMFGHLWVDFLGTVWIRW